MKLLEVLSMLNEKRSVPDTREEQIARAQQQGFDTSQVWYHGTSAERDFKKFRVGRGGYDELGPGVYLVPMSQIYVANLYANRSDTGRVIPCFVRKGPIWNWDIYLEQKSLRRSMLEPVVRAWIEYMIDLYGPNGTNETDAWERVPRFIKLDRNSDANRWLSIAGYIGARKRNSQVPDQLVVFDPEDVRSIFAKFKKPRGGLNEARGRYPRRDLFALDHFLDDHQEEIADWLTTQAGNWMRHHLERKTGRALDSHEEILDLLRTVDKTKLFDRGDVQTLINSLGADWDSYNNLLLEPKRTEFGWIVHFTKYGEQIARGGFLHGADPSRLGVTQPGWGGRSGTHRPQGEPGWNFGFPLRLKRDIDVAEYFADYGAKGQGYGSHAIFCKVRYQRFHHHGDNHDQAIFWGPDAKNLIHAWSQNGLWEIDEDSPMEFRDLINVIKGMG